MTTASIFSDFWGSLEEHHEQAVFLVLVGFLGSFAFIRMSTRIIRSESVSWWPGNIESESGLHLHHLVFGIVAMMVAGTLGFVADGRQPYTEICALLFGVGVGLTIDEFALWVHLEDVYWEKEGRSSIDATVIAAALMGLVVLGVNPLDTGTESEGWLALIVSGLLLVLVVSICFFKGRRLHGLIGFFVFPIALYGACRIAKPDSAWARRRYGERKPKKQAKSEGRFPPDRRTERFKNAFRDMVGGKPSEGVAAATEEALAATREAAEEIRQQAERVTHPGAHKKEDQ
jgi:hypothetical protein